jgi:hypothetical protein
MRFRNFSIWYGRLPHWRADGVTYYVTFRHSRPLDERECQLLLNSLVQPDGRRWDLLIACVLPEKTDLMFRVLEQAGGAPYELSSIVEKAKSKVGKAIVKKTGERFPPFYGESYDRIVRDQPEFEERWSEILSSPVDHEFVESPEEYAALFVKQLGA